MVAVSIDTALATYGHRAQLEVSRAGEGRQVVGAGRVYKFGKVSSSWIPRDEGVIRKYGCIMGPEKLGEGGSRT